MRRRALLVGIDRYPGLVDLRGCGEDARKLGEILSRHHGGQANFACKVLVDRDEEGMLLSRALLRRALRQLFADDAHADILFYFAGHGERTDTDTFICTPDAKPDDFGVRIDEVIELATGSRARCVLLIFDCCYAGAACQSIAQRRIKNPERLSITIIAATRGSDPAVEVDGSGTFTSALLDGLRGAAADGDGDITTSTLSEYVLRRSDHWVQRPQLVVNSGERYVLRKCTSEAASATTGTAARDHSAPTSSSPAPLVESSSSCAPHNLDRIPESSAPADETTARDASTPLPVTRRAKIPRRVLLGAAFAAPAALGVWTCTRPRRATVRIACADGEGSLGFQALQEVAKHLADSTGVSVECVAFPHEVFKTTFEEKVSSGDFDILECPAGKRIASVSTDLTALGPIQSLGCTEKKEGDPGLGFKEYPWVFFYSKEWWPKLFGDGVSTPSTWKELLDLAPILKARQPAVPLIGFGNSEGWPALGTFSILNMRINGAQTHADLIGNTYDWTSQGIGKVFQAWKELAQFYPDNYSELSSRDVALLLHEGKVGMYYTGSFSFDRLPEQVGRPPEEVFAGLDCFEFPVFDENKSDSYKGLDLPYDSFVVSALGKLRKDAEKVVCALGEVKTFEKYNKKNPLYLSARCDPIKYNYLQERMDAIRSAHKKPFRFLDRELDDPSLASDVFIPAFKKLLATESGYSSIQSAIESTKNLCPLVRQLAFRWKINS